MSKWTVVMSSFSLPWCTTSCLAAWWRLTGLGSPVHLQSALPAISSAECFLLHPFAKACTCILLSSLRALKNDLKAVATPGSTIATMVKHQWAYSSPGCDRRKKRSCSSEKKARMNRPVHGPQEDTAGWSSNVWPLHYLSVQQLPGGLSSNQWCSSMQGWNMGSLHRAGRNLYTGCCCCCCTLNTNK